MNLAIDTWCRAGACWLILAVLFGCRCTSGPDSRAGLVANCMRLDNGMRLNVSMPRAVWQGEPILVMATVCNQRQNEVVVPEPVNGLPFDLVVTRPDGMSAKPPSTMPTKASRFLYPTKLMPGAEIHREFDISREFDMTSPGVYRVLISLQVIDGTAEGRAMQLAAEALYVEVRTRH